MTQLALSAAPAATSALNATAIAARQAAIDVALRSKPTGPKGFLIWVRAAWPKPIADKIIAAAAKHQAASHAAATKGALATASNIAKVGMGRAPGMGRYSGPTTFGSVSHRLPVWNATQARRGMGAAPPKSFVLGRLGDATTDALGSDALSAFTVMPDTSSTVDNASTSSASPSWLSSIGTAVSAAVQGYLGVQQANDAQTLFNTNLQRAQQGLSPLNANPSAYGITSPQVNVGLSSSVQTMLIYGGLGLGAILVLNSVLKHTKKS